MIEDAGDGRRHNAIEDRVPPLSPKIARLNWRLAEAVELVKGEAGSERDEGAGREGSQKES